MASHLNYEIQTKITYIPHFSLHKLCPYIYQKCLINPHNISVILFCNGILQGEIIAAQGVSVHFMHCSQYLIINMLKTKSNLIDEICNNLKSV